MDFKKHRRPSRATMVWVLFVFLDQSLWLIHLHLAMWGKKPFVFWEWRIKCDPDLQWLLAPDGLVGYFRLLIYWDFHDIATSRIHRQWSQMEKISRERQFGVEEMPCWCQKSEENRQTGWRDPRKGTGTQITAGYNLDERKNDHFTTLGKILITLKKKKNIWGICDPEQQCWKTQTKT